MKMPFLPSFMMRHVLLTGDPYCNYVDPIQKLLSMLDLMAGLLCIMRVTVDALMQMWRRL
jgi:hypothetical protein